MSKFGINKNADMVEVLTNSQTGLTKSRPGTKSNNKRGRSSMASSHHPIAEEDMTPYTPLPEDRYINPELYPPGFDLNLVRGIKAGDAWPIKNYNNMVMDHHIVDETKIKAKFPKMNPDVLEKDFIERNYIPFVS